MGRGGGQTTTLATKDLLLIFLGYPAVMENGMDLIA